MMVSEPRSRMPARTLSFNPLIMALTVITVVMPMTIPRIVSAERSGFFRKVSNASSTSSPNFRARSLRTRERAGSAVVCGNVFPSVAMVGVPLFRSQRVHRIEFRGFRCRVSSEEETHAQRHQKSAEDGPKLHGTGQRRDPGHDLGQEHAKNHAQRAADARYRQCFDQKLHQNVAAARTDSFSQSDFA